MKRIVITLILVCAFFVPALFSQERSARVITVSLIENGTVLRFENSNTTVTDTAVALAVYWADGTSEWVSYNIPTEAGRQYMLSFMGQAVAIFGDEVIPSGPVTAKLNKRTTAISIVTDAQVAERKRQENAEKERQAAAAETAEQARKEALVLTSSGEAAASAGNNDKAMSDFTQAIRIDQNLAPAYVGRGLQYYNRRDWDRAIADFTEAIRLDPNYAAPYRHRAFAYMQKGNYVLARADVNMALRVNPNYQNAKDLDAELKRQGY